MRMMPCESVPRRFAQTSILAHSPACSFDRPTAAKTAATKAVRSALVMRRASWGMILFALLFLHVLSFVMLGLVPGISIQVARRCKGNRDGRDKPAHAVERSVLHFRNLIGTTDLYQSRICTPFQCSTPSKRRTWS